MLISLMLNAQVDGKKAKYKQRSKDLDALDRAAGDVLRCLSEAEKVEGDIESLERALSTTGSTQTPDDVQALMQEKDREM
jgi:hypothetical protein